MISTDPPSDKALDKGSTVKLFVSSGATKVEVPDLTGQSLSQALITLQNADLKGNPIEVTLPAGDARDGKVLTQVPAPKSQVAKGSTIQISIGKAAPAPTTQATTTTVATTVATTAPTTTLAPTTTAAAASTSSTLP